VSFCGRRVNGMGCHRPRGEISPSVATLERVLRAMGERLELSAGTLEGGNLSDAELREALALTPAERVQEAIALSRTVTGLASRSRHG
jgi:hypothetical protein